MPKKKFVYCESTDGGMQEYEFIFDSNDQIDFPSLYGWMTDGCQSSDTDLVEWAKVAPIGDYFNHRMGICFRVIPLS